MYNAIFELDAKWNGSDDDDLDIYVMEEDTVGEMVWDFHDKYFPDIALSPIDFDDDPAYVTEKLEGQLDKISEEVSEFLGAVDELADAVEAEDKYSLAELNALQEQVLKEICDVVYTMVGYCTAFGIDFDEAFRRVHESNMTKDGDYEGWKLHKGESYVAPDLSDLV